MRIKRFFQILYETGNPYQLQYEIYFTHTKSGKVKERDQYSIEDSMEIALKKVEKLVNSFLSIDKTKPRFNDWSLDDYWIEVYDGDRRVEVIDRESIDAIFGAKKFNL